VKGKDLVKLLMNHGWKVDRIKGSHHIMTKDTKTVVVPVHGTRDIPKGTENSIRRQAGLKQ